MKTKQIRYLKNTFKPGTRIELIYMLDEPRMKPGLTGIVKHVDDIGQIHVSWSNGSYLALNCEVDQFIAYIGQTTIEFDGHFIEKLPDDHSGKTERK